MESETISKNGASSKSYTSRRNNKQSKAMKYIFVSMLAVSMMFATGCRSKQPALPSVQAGSTEVEVPFSGREYRTNENFFRATQIGRSPDLSAAKRIALLNARTELASAVEATIKAVSTNYTNQRTIENRQEFASRFDEEARVIVNQRLNDVNIIGERVFREANGSYTYYVVIEMSKDALLNSLNDQISRDERLRLDFDQHQFRRVFEEEMRKFEQNR
jgi:hypothetical protein